MNKRLVYSAVIVAALAVGLGLWFRDEAPVARPIRPEQTTAAKLTPSVSDIADEAKSESAAAVLVQAAQPAATPSTPKVKRRVPTAADASPVNGRPPASMPLAPDFLEKIIEPGEKTARFKLPDGREAAGDVELLRRDEQGVLVVQGR